uniref:Alpha-2-macroglobulin domain-containing protein n=1 Tax=Otolemur garnettii TaxID=30611 RepID=H0XSQ1_OTOGA
PVKEIVRKYFPETWIWDLVELDLSGGKELEMKVPDTITEWKASAFCLSETTGLGLSPVVPFQVFQPFFLELSLPYSVVRGEAFTLKATVSNYLSHCIRKKHLILVLALGKILSIYPNFYLFFNSLIVNHKIHSCVPYPVPMSLHKLVVGVGAGQCAAGNLICLPEREGKKYAVSIHLFKKPQKCSRNKLYMINLNFTEKLIVALVETWIASKQREMKGCIQTMQKRFITKTEHLSHFPYLDIFCRKFLVFKNPHTIDVILTGKMKEEGVFTLCIKRGGEGEDRKRMGCSKIRRNHSGNAVLMVGLTAFVLKSFAQAQTFIFVENSHIVNALSWLSQKQKENGCFQMSGSLLNNAMKVMSFLIFLWFPKIVIFLQFRHSFEKGWQTLNLQKSNNEVEMTSYVLLAYLTVQPAPSSGDLSKASRIVKWITKQQNPHGGFSSTQDTVVALQALSKYGAATFTKNEKAALVTVKSSDAFSKEFQVDDANRLLLQEVRLPEIPGEYNTTVSGSGCVYLQKTLRH